MNSGLRLKLFADLVEILEFVVFLVFEEATVFCCRTGIRMIALHPDEIVTMFLRINHSSFGHLSCERPGFARIDLVRFYKHIIEQVQDGDSVTIQTGWQDRSVDYVINDDVTGNIRKEGRLGLIKLKDEHLAICDKLQYTYNVKIAVHSLTLMRIFALLHMFRQIDPVCITITDSEVEFAAINIKFVLLRERGDCKIQGLGERDQVFFVINIRHWKLLLYALDRSNITYLCYSDDAPPMLQFPFLDIDGEIRFYFKDK